MSTAPAGYEGAILPLIVLTILAIIWIYAQAQLTQAHSPTHNTNRKQKKQNSEQLDAIKRLQDVPGQSASQNKPLAHNRLYAKALNAREGYR
jgi:hypothetical protein